MSLTSRHWHVTLTMGGQPVEARLVRAALLRLQDERPFLDAVRYSSETAEIQFWDEGDTMLDVASLALRLWGEHRESSTLPAWMVVGLEIVEQRVFDDRRKGSGAVSSGPTLAPLTP